MRTGPAATTTAVVAVAAVVVVVGLMGWLVAGRPGLSLQPASGPVEEAAAAAGPGARQPARTGGPASGNGGEPGGAGRSEAVTSEVAINRACGAAVTPRPAATETESDTESDTDTDADAGPTPINTEGDLGPESREYYAGLAAEHDGEVPDEPVVLRWVVEASGSPVVDVEEVACVAERAFADPRGWNLGGAIRFERVGDAADADFVLVVAEAPTVPSFDESCLSSLTGVPDASCTVGNYVIINDERWRDGALGDPIPLEQFRIHEINHETGHWLGQGHFSCLGGVAAVNQQQFRALHGCTPNAWPLPFERAMVAARFGLWPSLGASEPYGDAGWDTGSDADTTTDTITDAADQPPVGEHPDAG